MNNNITAIILSFIAGLSTLIGCTFMFINKKSKTKVLSFTFIFSFKIIISILILNLSKESYKYLLFNVRYPFFETLLFVAIGISIGKIINKVKISNKASDNKLYRVGLISCIVLILHNIPEGIITYIANTSSVGIILCLAITLHNIPEGIMISLPIYYSTNSKLTAFKYTLLSALSEPFGAILSYVILSRYISDRTLGIVLALVTGLMLHIALDEISPLIKTYNEKKYQILGIVSSVILLIIIKIILR